MIVARERVVVGEGASVGDWAIVSDAAQPGPGADVEAPLREQPVATRPVTIAPGARVGAHAAIGAGASVSGSVGSYAVLSTPAADR